MHNFRVINLINIIITITGEVMSGLKVNEKYDLVKVATNTFSFSLKKSIVYINITKFKSVR